MAYIHSSHSFEVNFIHLTLWSQAKQFCFPESAEKTSGLKGKQIKVISFPRIQTLSAWYIFKDFP